jgi:hypothetical protein
MGVSTPIGMGSHTIAMHMDMETLKPYPFKHLRQYFVLRSCPQSRYFSRTEGATMSATKTFPDIRPLVARLVEFELENETLRDDKDRLERINAELRNENDQLKRDYHRLEAAYEAKQASGIEIVRGSDEEQVYWASNTRHKIHRPGCTWASYIPTYKRIEFSSRREAVEAGFIPCNTCRA